MLGTELLKELKNYGFTRVERDDRLLDIFPAENSEKGIELWERWDAEVVHLLRFHLPYRPKYIKQYKFPRQKLENLLYKNETKKLSSFKPTANSFEL